MAGYFHLRAQMKVTKAKGLTRSEQIASAREFGRRRSPRLVTTRVQNDKRMHWLFVPDALDFQVARSFDNRIF
jgi:hypothetical protein